MARKTKAEQVELPKWPAMTVHGVHITREQAGEVLIRTNRWDQHTNDRRWNEQVWKMAGVPLADSYLSNFDEIRRVEERLRVLPLQYLRNERIASSWLGGPHGWCDWDGTIFSNQYNIGKWPQVNEVRDEWAVIAKTFPFLNLVCTLWSEEAGVPNNKPLVCFRVVKGRVRAGVVTAETRHWQYRRFTPTSPTLKLTDRNERGCDEASLRQAIARVLESTPSPTDWARLSCAKEVFVSER